MARLQRAETPHTTWCTRDHRCGIEEHRSPDITADEIGGRAWITRVRAGNREYAEIRARIPLHPNDQVARAQLVLCLEIMRELLIEVAARLIRLPGRNRQRAIGRKAA
ncbi:hypothetical protein AB0F81_11620 [Actinoplanes sp. NPDC024001]|uniref:hypothetical protein n=1 Tax=Actinoplanes sp. NPDC024001 TaxID=3154598 RepID=UPI0033E6816C